MTLDHSIEQDPPVYGWDWTATTHDARGSTSTVKEVVSDLVDGLGGALALPSEKGLQGWAQSVDVFDGAGYRLGRVFFGGERTDVHVLSTSAAADTVRSSMASAYAARTARVDTRVDCQVPFDDLAELLEQAGNAYGSRITRMESHVRGESTGRTVYLGSPASAIRVRLYEKWLESPGQYEDGTNRVEVQLRPPSKAKATVSGWTRQETFCASRTTQALAEALGDELVPANSLHIDRGTPDLEKSLQAMGNQYGGAVNRWLSRSGGDLERVLDYLIPDGVWKDV